jgi:hypothetical protein
MNVQKLKLGLPSLSSHSIQEQSEAEFRAMTNAVPAIIWDVRFASASSTSGR